MNNDDINDYLPSILNPRAVKKQDGDLTLTQNSIISRCSLSLRKKKNGISNNISKHPLRVQTQNITNRNPHIAHSITKGKSSEVRRHTFSTSVLNSVYATDKENSQNIQNINACTSPKKNITNPKTIEECSLGFSAVEDINTVRICEESSPLSFNDFIEPVTKDLVIPDNKSTHSIISVSSATELLDDDCSTIVYKITERSLIALSFGVVNCDSVNISTKNCNIKKINITHKDNCSTNVDCEMIEDLPMSIDISSEEEDCNASPSPPKKSTVAVNLEIKKKSEENSKVLILNTDAIERLSHVIVQPPNYKLVKRNFFDKRKFKNSYRRKIGVKNVNDVHCGLKQLTIDRYFNRKTQSTETFGVSERVDHVLCKNNEDMSKKSGVVDVIKASPSRSPYRAVRKENEATAQRPRSRSTAKEEESPLRPQNIRSATADTQRVRTKLRHDGGMSGTPRKIVDSVQFSVPTKSKSTRSSASPKPIPHYKIIAGANFAVDAFSYGDIPNIRHYFLTHFHSDHYAGLKKSFTKSLFCSKITAELCMARLGVNSKYIHVLNFEETISIDGIEVTVVDANHCPGAIMLLFTLPNGKSLLHTGDFRASPAMESYPIFWNKDIHTVYLDTTYCNPRYDFPTQDQSLEMALSYLRQKKLALEKLGKKFSSVLIVCGTYTIGKEKFFLGMARRVGCSVWACPEKDRVLQIVEGRSFSHASPESCQLHVVPMRDLTFEKLRSYLDSLQSAFSEVVAFKPSGWENGKNSTVAKDNVTIHGIPYSEHSSFSEMLRFVNFLKPQQVVPTVDISGGTRSVQKYFPCPLVLKEDGSQSKVTDYFSIQRPQVPAVT